MLFPANINRVLTLKNKKIAGVNAVNDSRERKETMQHVPFPALSAKTPFCSHFLFSSPPSKPHGCPAEPKYWQQTYTLPDSTYKILSWTHTKRRASHLLLLKKLPLNCALQLVMQEVWRLTNFTLTGTKQYLAHACNILVSEKSQEHSRTVLWITLWSLPTQHRSHQVIGCAYCFNIWQRHYCNL